MLADIQRTVYFEEVTRQLHVMAQARKSSAVIDRRSNHGLALTVFCDSLSTSWARKIRVTLLLAISSLLVNF